MRTLAYLTLQPPGKTEHVMLWLHGLGASNDDFATLLPSSGLGSSHHVQFILPNAPMRPVTVYQGEVVRAWYDVYDFNSILREDAQGLSETAHALSQLIEEVHSQGIAYHRIWLGGYSQGGAMALWTGLAYPKRLAGIVGLSTYMAGMSHFDAVAQKANQDIPILLAHGQFDDVLPWPLHQLSRSFLEQRGYSIDCHAYPIGHSVCLEEMQLLRDWFAKHAHD